MDWNIISAISDLLAAVAVVISLLYVARQLRDAKNESSVENTHRITESLNSYFLEIESSGELSNIFHEGLKNPYSLTKEDRRRFMVLLNIIVGRYADVHYRYEKGTLSSDYWFGPKKNLTGLLRTPGGRVWWEKGNAEWMAPNFKKIIDQQFEDDASADAEC